jgi:hypothetical protein
MMMYRNTNAYCKDHTKQIYCVIKCSTLLKKQVALGTVSTVFYKVKSNEKTSLSSVFLIHREHMELTKFLILENIYTPK